MQIEAGTTRAAVVGMLIGHNPYLVRARHRFGRLTGEQQREIAVGFERHRRACDSLGIQPDPAWLAEAIDDMTMNRPGIWEVE